MFRVVPVLVQIAVHRNGTKEFNPAAAVVLFFSVHVPCHPPSFFCYAQDSCLPILTSGSILSVGFVHFYAADFVLASTIRQVAQSALDSEDVVALQWLPEDF